MIPSPTPASPPEPSGARRAIGDFAHELVELITHLAFYVGWPSAMSAVKRAKELLAKKQS